MIFGAVLAEGERYYTDMKRIFEGLGGRQREYNWLITDWETNLSEKAVLNRNGGKYCWMTGNELTELVEKCEFQWIWAALSGFPKEISLEKVLEEPLPEADVPGLWMTPLTIQHPRAEIEIVAFDSTMAILLTRNREICELFRKNLPLSGDLIEHIGGRK